MLSKTRDKIVALAVVGAMSVTVLAGAVSCADLSGGQPDPVSQEAVFYGGAERDMSVPVVATDVQTPQNADGSGVWINDQGIGVPDRSQVTVELYFDFGCQWCAKFEGQHAEMLYELAAGGDVAIVDRPVAFLDEDRGTYSTRALNAAAVVLDREPEFYPAFRQALLTASFEDQVAGLTDEQIAQAARDVGVAEATIETFVDAEPGKGRTFAAWAVSNTQTAAEALGGLSTPTVVIDGTVFPQERLFEEDALRNAIDAAVEARRLARR